MMFHFLECVWSGNIIYINAVHMHVRVGKIKEVCFTPGMESMWGLYDTYFLCLNWSFTRQDVEGAALCSTGKL